jgi:pimeloyl-ACP methyl ester carboxylesterase
VTGGTEFTITGGAGGIRAFFDDMDRTAELLRGAGGDLLGLTNLRLMALEPTLRTEAVADALHRAGAGPDDPVLLMGHSQGGMLAMEAAAEFSRDGRYNVTDVITAGAPVARMPVPDHVRVLSLENAHDIVPHLDGQPNPDEPNRITVTFARQNNAIGDNHDMFTVYRVAGHDLDAVRDPSLDAYRASLQGRFIFNERAAGVSVQPYVYDVRRGL